MEIAKYVDVENFLRALQIRDCDLSSRRSSSEGEVLRLTFLIPLMIIQAGASELMFLGVFCTVIGDGF